MPDKEAHEIALISLFGILFVVNIIDYASTVAGLARGLIEINPLARFLMSYIGEIPAFVALKGIFTAVIGVTIYVVVKETPSSFFDDDMLLLGMTILNIVGFLVLSNNLSYLGLWPSILPAFHFSP